MRMFGGAAIRMRRDFDEKKLSELSFLLGDETVIAAMPELPVRRPFDNEVCDYLHAVSRALMADPRSRQFPDVVTLAFWLRRGSVAQMEERFLHNDVFRVGRGVAFHIAPSNVAVNFAYSLFAGLMTGNANIVRVPSKPFEQVDIIVAAIRAALDSHKAMAAYLALVRYERSRDVNDLLSSIADIRIVWGGDATISELRASQLPPRSVEITFADRYSLAVIDSDVYLAIENKEKVAQKFYNDTYLSDQNACTSPRVVVWTGQQTEKAKAVFWDALHELVQEKYQHQPIQSVNKLTSSYLAAIDLSGIKIEPHEDNLIVRAKTPQLSPDLMDHKEHSGFFFEYDCGDIMELLDFCNDTRCQTIAYIGEKDPLRLLLNSGVRGVDRVVPVGKTMDFDLIWDGYDLVAQMTRVISG